MESVNYSKLTEFILLGLSTDPNLQLLLFLIFLIVYISTVTGNLLLIVAVRVDHRLHSSMYLFLVNLSFLDICYTSIVLPNMLMNLRTGNKRISYSGCLFQVYSFTLLAEAECFILAVMAYDRLVAIRNPLRYSTIMGTTTCIKMICGSWMPAFMISSVDIYVLNQFNFCGPNTINHYFCESLSIMQLICNDLALTNSIILLFSCILLFVPLSFIVYTYLQIIRAVLRIQASRYKAFFTCFSHLAIGILFYGSAMVIYLKPEHTDISSHKVFAVIYTTVTPMLNPIIYSLRNKDVQGAFKSIRKCLVISK